MNANTNNAKVTGKAAGKANKAQGVKLDKVGKGKVKPDAWAFDGAMLGQLGQEMAQAAAQQTQAAGTYWDRCRTHYVAAQDHGKAQEALDALFGPGEKVKGKKAPWYRTYKSLLSTANEIGVTVTNDMGMSALQKAIKLAKEEASENDPETAAAKDAQLLDMFTKMAQGCLNRGISKAKLAAILKGLE